MVDNVVSSCKVSILELSKDSTALQEYILSKIKSSRILLKEELEELPQKELTVFLCNITQILKDKTLNVNGDFEDIHAVSQILDILLDIEHEVTGLVIEPLEVIHDVLLQFSDKNSFVQNHSSEVLEKCWRLKISGSDKFAVNVPPYLLARTLCPIGKQADIMRLNDVKEMLSLINFGCESSACLTSFLCAAASSALFLKSNDGIEFLSYIMTLNNDLMKILHESLKNAIPDLKENLLVKVGALYYQSISLLKGQELFIAYKKECLQELVFCSLHCHRSGSFRAAPEFLKVLSVFHKHKEEPSVEGLLYELYLPLLWRALDVANGEVRANAVSLFLDVFPLLPSSANKVQIQDSMEEQCSKIKEMLIDTNESARACAVRGCAKVLDRCWQLIPVHHLKTLLTLMCCELTQDGASSEVSIAALKGIQLLANNPLSHVAFKKLLPTLINHIYHHSSAVRTMMLNLLQTLQQTTSLKFWDILPLEELVEIVETCKPGAFRSKLVSLLVPFYFPVDEPLSLQVQMTLILLKSHPLIHRAFYMDAYPHVGMSSYLKMAVALLSTVNECIDKGEIVFEEGNNSKLGILSEDTEKIGQILETSAILVAVAGADLSRNSRAGAALCSKLTPTLAKILYHFGKDPFCNEAISILMSCLPDEGLHTMKKHLYKICKSEVSAPSIVSSAAAALLKIGSGGKILTFWSNCISQRLEGLMEASVADPNAKTPVELPSTLPTRILSVLSTLLEHSPALLDAPEADTLYCTLLAVADIIPRWAPRLRPDQFRFLVEALALAGRLSIHIGGVEDLAQIADCVWSVLEKSKPGNKQRIAILDEVYPVLVEGFQILPYNGPFLSTLHKIALASTSHLHLPTCKFLYRAGNFLSHHPHPDIDLVALLERTCGRALETAARKDLADVECLVLEVGISAQKHVLCSARVRPWEGAGVALARVVAEGLGEEDAGKEGLLPLLQILLDCVDSSESFRALLLPILESEAVKCEKMNRFLKMVA